MTAGILLAEGDSWFDYPLHHVLQGLGRLGYRIESTAHRGDTLESMAYDPRQLQEFGARFRRLARRSVTPTAILLSAGGNDIAGEELGVLLNHKASGLPPLNELAVEGVLKGRVYSAMVSLLTAISGMCVLHFGHVCPILVHGYDYPTPDGRGYLGGRWLLPGPWLSPPFRRKGYMDEAERGGIMAELVDVFNQMLATLALEPGLEHVRYVNLRGTVSSEWANELHPTSRGFEAIAAVFQEHLC